MAWKLVNWDKDNLTVVCSADTDREAELGAFNYLLKQPIKPQPEYLSRLYVKRNPDGRTYAFHIPEMKKKR